MILKLLAELDLSCCTYVSFQILQIKNLSNHVNKQGPLALLSDKTNLIDR